ncbi:MAG: aspartate aminotransferase family protein [Acetobacterales bacterium]
MNKPLANSPAARDIAHVFHPQTDLAGIRQSGPLIVSRGKGVRVWDEDGTEYIETMAGLWCTALGFDNERLVEAAVRQMRKLPFYHGFAARGHEPMIDLAEKLMAIAPVPMSKAFFANSGSEANDTAIKLCWYYNNALGRPEKKKIVSRQKAYHGVTIATGSLTGLPPIHNDFDLPLRSGHFLHTTCPHHYRVAEAGESEEQFADRCASDLEKLIEDEGPETIAAFFAEPVMGAGGVMLPPRTYFEKIQAILKKHDILFVADEVVTGFGRTGNMWGSQTYDLQPDMITCAKALSSAYLPISALLVNDRVYDVMVSQSEKLGIFGHGYTYSGHPVPAAVAVETLKIYEEIDIVGHVRDVGPYMQKQLQERFAGHPLVGNVRGIGLIAGVELMKDGPLRIPFDPKLKVGPNVMKAAQRHGLIMRAIGDTLAFSPPLVIDRNEIDQMCERFQATLDEVLGMLQRSGELARGA